MSDRTRTSFAPQSVIGRPVRHKRNATLKQCIMENLPKLRTDLSTVVYFPKFNSLDVKLQLIPHKNCFCTRFSSCGVGAEIPNIVYHYASLQGGADPNGTGISMGLLQILNGTDEIGTFDLLSNIARHWRATRLTASAASRFVIF